MGNLLKWFVRRAVETVDSWNGSASNYADAAAYCKACLIDVNPSGTEKKASLCKLPVKRPGSSAYADKGIMAAAGGHGLGQVKKPTGVDQSVWDTAVQKAAKTIVNAYKDMDKEPPQAMMDMMRSIPFTALRAVSVDSIFQQLQHAIYEGMELWGMAGNEVGYLVTVYIDNGELYALFNKEGLLRRSLLTLDANDVVTMGPLEDVSQQFTPTQRSTVSITRQTDGTYRVFMLAATALVNKAGQIDSTALFDDMIRRANEYDFWPTIDIAHLGEEDESCEFGQIDFLAREGICYLASGVLDPKHPLTPYVVDALQKRAAEWGNSIEYFPLLESIEYLTLGGLEIPVFTQGLNTRISILPVEDACSWFTSVGMEEMTMTEAQKRALRKMLGDEEYNRRMAQIEGVNEEADRRQLIFRATPEGEPSAETETPVAETPQGGAGTPAETPATTDAAPETPQGGASTPLVANAELTPEGVIEFDDETLASIAGLIINSQSFTDVLQQAFTQFQEQVNTTIATATQSMTDLLRTSLEPVTQRMADLEAENAESMAIARVDVPRRATDTKLRMTVRPRERHADEPAPEETYADIAAKTLAKFPKSPVYN